LFLYDIKANDTFVHKKLTGAGNELIKENLKKLASLSKVLVRVPVIAGDSGNIGEMEGIAKFLGGMDIDSCELLPYHRLGEGKYKSLGITCDYIFEEPSKTMMEDMKKMFCANGINIK
jgi:pyruvate formate lyase activating enzyme